MLAHNVFFSLHDKSPEAVAKLINEIKTYLTAHAGTMFFACGTPEPDLARPVNDRDFDVALHIVFNSRADHDIYQGAPRHMTFVERNKETWAKVRVFDTVVD